MSQMQNRAGLTRSQQNNRVLYLGFVFMLMFTAFNSLQNSVSVIYQRPGFESLGKVSLLTIYAVFGVCTFFTAFVIRKFGYKKVFLISAFGYALYSIAGLVVVMWEDIPVGLGWFIVMLGACTTGAGASCIWVAQGSYVSSVAGQDRKTELFGLFFILMMSSQILGNVLITFVLGAIGKTAYFTVTTALNIASSFLFLLVPNVDEAEEGEQITVANQVRKITTILKDAKYKFLNIYLFFPGVTIGFYATFVSTLVKQNLPQQADEIADDYTKRIDTMRGYVFITLGVTQAISGFIINRFFEPFCKYKLAIVGTAIVEAATFASFLCYHLESYGLCFLVSALWGFSEIFLQTNTGSLMGKVFPGKVEAFSVFRVVFAFGVVFTIILNIALQDVDHWVFLTVIFIVQLVTIIISTQIMDLKEQRTSTLMEKEDSDRLLPNQK